MKVKANTIDLLALISLDQLLFIENIINVFHKARYFNEGVNCTEPSPSFSIPWEIISHYSYETLNCELHASLKSLTKATAKPSV
jgi:hypothetical protein